jgi:hypothetical protein
MADETSTGKRTDEGIPVLVRELFDLLVRYAKQETLDPLKSLLRFIGWGVGGAICIGMGLVLLSLALLRVLQEELAPHLSGNLSWIPYLVLVAVAGALIGLLVRAIGVEKRRADAERVRLGRG